MRRSPSILVIFPWISAGADRGEAITAHGIRQRPSRAGEIRIERRVVLVFNVEISSGGIGLPDFDQRVGDRTAVLVAHAAAYNDAFSHRFAGVLSCQIAAR